MVVFANGSDSGFAELHVLIVEPQMYGKNISAPLIGEVLSAKGSDFLVVGGNLIAPVGFEEIFQYPATGFFRKFPAEFLPGFLPGNNKACGVAFEQFLRKQGCVAGDEVHVRGDLTFRGGVGDSFLDLKEKGWDSNRLIDGVEQNQKGDEFFFLARRARSGGCATFAQFKLHFFSCAENFLAGVWSHGVDVVVQCA